MIGRPLFETIGFRRRFLQSEALVGSFLKDANGITAELLGHLGFDFVIADQEHCSYGREGTDRILLAARAVGIFGIVRVGSDQHPEILAALDAGADGLLVPHVTTPEQANNLVQATRYRGGRRGFALATRAGGWGTIPTAQHLDGSDARVALIAQIEDAEAIDRAGEIAGVEGVDGLFIGRGDLFVSMGLEDINDPRADEACRRIAAGARAAGKAVSSFVANAEEAARLRPLGITTFMLNSDIGLLRQAAQQELTRFRALSPVSSAE